MESNVCFIWWILYFRVYADVTLNHMAEVGSSGLGTGGSFYVDPQYPMVQLSYSDFNDARNCSTKDLTAHNYKNKTEVRNCRLQALNDLKIFTERVRKVQLDFLNKLIDIGVAGFRIDAAKHMWPSELEQLYLQLHHLNNRYFPFDTSRGSGYWHGWAAVWCSRVYQERQGHQLWIWVSHCKNISVSANSGHQYYLTTMRTEFYKFLLCLPTIDDYTMQKPDWIILTKMDDFNLFLNSRSKLYFLTF